MPARVVDLPPIDSVDSVVFVLVLEGRLLTCLVFCGVIYVKY